MRVRLRINVNDAVLDAATAIYKGGEERVLLADQLFERLRPLSGDDDEIWIDVDTENGDLHVVTQRVDENDLIRFNRVQVWPT